MPRLLEGVCRRLGWRIGLWWSFDAAADELSCAAAHVDPGHEDLVPQLCRQAPEDRTTPARRALDTGELVCWQNLDRDPPRSGLAPDPRLGIVVAVPVRSHDGEPLAVLELFRDRGELRPGLRETLSAIAAVVAQYLERERGERETQRMRDEFVATVSHELRTPLTAIDGWLHVLLSEEPGPLTEDQRRFLNTVKRNSARLMRLVGHLLLSQQLESGRLELELGEVDVAELAREAVELISASATEKGIELDAQLDGPVVVHGDQGRLAQLLGNLLANAVKFTPAGGRVSISARAEAGTCRIAVSDTGVGIPEGERDRLFQRFYRASSATRNGISGTGLGLSISKAIAESHGGSISVAGAHGPGTTFVVELPLAVRERTPA
jgi:signal transduction histidine kinase